MSHVDPDVLALMALGEPADGDADIAHLGQCASCADSLARFSDAARIGRRAIDSGPLLKPAPSVWGAVQAQLGLSGIPLPGYAGGGSYPGPLSGGTGHRGAASTVDDPVLEGAGTTDGAGTQGAGPHTPEPVDLSSRRNWRTPRLAGILVAAVVLGLLGIGQFVQWQTTERPQSRPIASASLAAFPDWPDAGGSAVARTLSNGTRELHVSVRAPSPTGAFREVWLITSDAAHLVSLGVLDGSSGSFAIPEGVNLKDYDLVDVSEEPLDGNPQHSGNSIVRGALS